MRQHPKPGRLSLFLSRYADFDEMTVEGTRSSMAIEKCKSMLNMCIISQLSSLESGTPPLGPEPKISAADMCTSHCACAVRSGSRPSTSLSLFHLQVKEYIFINMEVSINRGTPSHHPFIDGISSIFIGFSGFPGHKNHPSIWGYPHDELKTPI